MKRILVEKAANIDREFYLGFVLDRETSRVAIIASTEGGVEIEKVAAETPEKIRVFSYLDLAEQEKPRGLRHIFQMVFI